MKTLPCGNISYFWTWFHPVLYLLHAVQLGKSLCFRKSVIFCRLLPTTSPSFSLSCCTTKCAFELKSICHSNKEEQRCWVTEFGHSAAVYRDTYLLVVLFCVSRSSTWGSLPLGIYEAEFHPFLTVSCITTPTNIADYADVLRSNVYLLSEGWNSATDLSIRRNPLRSTYRSLDPGCNYGRPSVAWVIVAEAGRWETRAGRKRYRPLHFVDDLSHFCCTNRMCDRSPFDR